MNATQHPDAAIEELRANNAALLNRIRALEETVKAMDARLRDVEGATVALAQSVVVLNMRAKP